MLSPDGDLAALVGGDHQLGTVAGVQLGQQLPDVGFHGGHADDEVIGDLGVGESLADEPDAVPAALATTVTTTVVALVALGLGATLRSTAAGLVTSIGLLFVVPFVSNFLPTAMAKWALSVSLLALPDQLAGTASAGAALTSAGAAIALAGCPHRPHGGLVHLVAQGRLSRVKAARQRI